MYKFIFILGLYGLINPIQAQFDANLLHLYSWSNCNLNDSKGIENAELLSGTTTCECGMIGDAMSFDGNTVIQLGSDSSDIGKTLTSEEFSISLALYSPRNNGPMTVMAIMEDCDSFGWELIYDPSRFEFRIRFISQTNVNNIIVSDDRTACWQQIAVNRYFNKVEFIVNGELKASSIFNTPQNTASLGQPTIGGGGCSGVFSDNFVGLIDEIRIYNRVMSAETAQNLTRYKINSLNDHFQVIFPGESFYAVLNAACDDNISWSPINSVSDPNSAETDLSPTSTTKYTVTVNTLGCLDQDTILIKVVDPATIQCSHLLLPNTFTPNGDFLNDEFGISNYYIIDESKRSLFEIFNLQGATIFSTGDPRAKWDGNVNGDKAPPGVYMYKVKYTCSDQNYTKQGSLNLIR